jgi:hypothetical protein
MDIQRVPPRAAVAQADSARLSRISAQPGPSRPAAPERGLPRISAPQVTSDPALQSVLSAEESRALEQLFSAFRTAAQQGLTGTYTDRGTVPRLPPLGGGRPGQLIDVIG